MLPSLMVMLLFLVVAGLYIYSKFNLKASKITGIISLVLCVVSIFFFFLSVRDYKAREEEKINITEKTENTELESEKTNETEKE